MTVTHSMETVLVDAESLPLSTNSRAERRASYLAVLHAMAFGPARDEVLWMLGLHYKPEPPHARRHPMYSGKVIPAEVPDEP